MPSVISSFAQDLNDFLDDFVKVQQHLDAEKAIMKLMRKYGSLLGDPADEK